MLIPATLPLPADAQLRPLRLADADPLARTIEANLEHLRPWMPWANGYEPISTLAFVEAAQRQMREEQGAQFAMVRGPAVLGTIGFHAVSWPNRSTSIGYWLAAAEQGRGIVTEAVCALSRLAFERWGLHRIELRAQPDNVRSRAVAERCGFTREGVAREAERVGDTFHDLVVYARLATDRVA